jgi:hypothetical protein
MRNASADLIEIPDDCRLVGIVHLAAALNTTERRARQLLAAASLPLIQTGKRSHGVRLSDMRRLLKHHERHPQ